MTMKSISVIRKEPGGAYFEDRLRNDLESFQAAVGGYIEAVSLLPQVVTPDGICTHTGIAIICDEEGRLKGKPYNCNIAGTGFVGPIVIVGVYEDEFTDVPVHIEALEAITT